VPYLLLYCQQTQSRRRRKYRARESQRQRWDRRNAFSNCAGVAQAALPHWHRRLEMSVAAMARMPDRACPCVDFSRVLFRETWEGNLAPGCRGCAVQMQVQVQNNKDTVQRPMINHDAENTVTVTTHDDASLLFSSLLISAQPRRVRPLFSAFPERPLQ
jgi:hypothetical protein